MKYFKAAIAIIALWGATFVGGGVFVKLMSAFSYARYEVALGKYALGIISGPVGVILGKIAMDKLTESGAYIFRAVNYIVIACFVSFVIGFGFFAKTISVYSFLLFGATVITAGFLAAAEFNEMQERAR